MSTKKMQKKAEKLLTSYRKKKLKLVTAESCTGGMLATTLTGVPGASDVFERGFVTYSDASKADLLGVPTTTIARHGSVSAEVAEAMARGALDHANADLAIAITGVAGPGGGTKKKPVGLVYLAVASRHYKDAVVEKRTFKGKRDAVRSRSVDRSLTILKKLQAFF
ncbi:MAG: CinA family protein [Pseudomonadota bacterium]|nr:CinA family protein [Pseudomonadota bacterium]MDE3036907.1 CinA family protein [Pseudomonadota bacterium]